MDETDLSQTPVSVDLSEYPKEVTLKNGARVTLRPMAREDRDLLLRFSSSLPEGERAYLRDDFVNPAVIHSETWDPAAVDSISIVATDGKVFAGTARIGRYPFPWNRHMGNIRVTIAPAYRRNGLARILLGEVFSKTLPTGIEKVIAEVVAGQEDARKALASLGFYEDAVLREYHLDPGGRKHDVLFMSNDLNQLWDKWRQYCESVSWTWHMED
jgi:RimJ/RimL family protein N-acetyltransferase